MMTRNEEKIQESEQAIREASFEIEQSISDLKNQMESGLDQVHHYLEAMKSPLVLFGSVLRIGIFLGETLGNRLETQRLAEPIERIGS